MKTIRVKRKTRATRPRATRSPFVMDRFFEKVVKDEYGCWLWVGSQTDAGYGLFRSGRRTELAHRFSYIYHHAEDLPDGWAKQIDHTCEQTACVNPAHLKLVTPADNSRRRKPYEVGTARKKRERGGGCVHGHGPEHQRVRRSDNATVCRQCEREYRQRKLAQRGPLEPLPPKPINHGTYGGYRTHKHRNEVPCEPCLEANRTYQREWQRDKYNRTPRRKHEPVAT